MQFSGFVSAPGLGSLCLSVPGNDKAHICLCSDGAPGGAVSSYHSSRGSRPRDPGKMSGTDRPRRGEPYLPSPYQVAREPGDWLAAGIPSS